MLSKKLSKALQRDKPQQSIHATTPSKSATKDWLVGKGFLSSEMYSNFVSSDQQKSQTCNKTFIKSKAGTCMLINSVFQSYLSE